MPAPERVLIATSAFYAVVSSTDAFHEQAQEGWERLIDRERQLWTTSYVLVETMALVHHRLGFETLRTFIETLQGIVQVFWIESSIHNEAWRQMVVSRGSGLGFVDWTTALAVRRLGAHLFTFDRGFAEHGIAVLPW